MINIRPVSDLRNKYPEMEKELFSTGEPIILTKNGYGSTVLITLEQFERFTDEIGIKLKEADIYANSTSLRYSGEEAFAKARAALNE